MIVESAWWIKKIFKSRKNYFCWLCMDNLKGKESDITFVFFGCTNWDPSYWRKKRHETAKWSNTSALLTMPKPLTVWITTNCGKSFKRWEYQTILPASWEICMHVKKQQLELDMEHKTDSKSGKECVKTVYCHPAYLTYIQSTSCEMLGWMKHKLESRLLG